MGAERGGYPDQGYLGMRGTRYPEVLDEGYPAYPSQPGSRGAGTRYLVPEGRTRYQEQEYNYNSELDTSGRYRSYKDSSGDQGDVDSGDDPQEHPVGGLHVRQLPPQLPSSLHYHDPHQMYNSHL